MQISTGSKGSSEIPSLQGNYAQILAYNRKEKPYYLALENGNFCSMFERGYIHGDIIRVQEFLWDSLPTG